MWGLTNYRVKCDEAGPSVVCILPAANEANEAVTSERQAAGEGEPRDDGKITKNRWQTIKSEVPQK